MDMLLPQDMSLRFQGCSQGKAPQSPNGRFRFHPEALDNLLKSRMIFSARLQKLPKFRLPIFLRKHKKTTAKVICIVVPNGTFSQDKT